MLASAIDAKRRLERIYGLAAGEGARRATLALRAQPEHGSELELLGRPARRLFVWRNSLEHRSKNIRADAKNVLER